MPGFDGTGPLGRGSMTGRGMGFCVLKEKKDDPGQVKGLVGIQGTPVNLDSSFMIEQQREVLGVPYLGGTPPWLVRGIRFGCGRGIALDRGVGHGRGRCRGRCGHEW